MSLDQAVTLHHQAEAARENKEYERALGFYAQALLSYAAAESLAGVSEVHAALSITYRHLLARAVSSAEQDVWKKATELSVQASLEYAELAAKHGDPTARAMTFFNAAKYYELTNDLTSAIKTFEKAVQSMENEPPEKHNRPAVLWDFKLKLSLAQLAQSGTQDVTEIMGQIMQAIEALEADRGVDADYNIKVWISGAYLRLAVHFKEINQEQARAYLDKAKAIIFTDDRLKVRQENYQKIAQELA